MKIIKVFVSAAVITVLASCAGTRTFNDYAKGGDTVAVAAGLKKNFTRDDITITITDSVGDVVIYEPGNSSVRSVVNLYPDPLSSVIVSGETGLSISPFSSLYKNFINSNFTGRDNDWWQTVIFVDLPTDMSTGEATIDINNTIGDSATSAVEIISGTGEAHGFDAIFAGELMPDQLLVLERVEHYTIILSSASNVIPYGVDLIFTHDADAYKGGVGATHVSNPRGDLKNVSWSDDGYTTRVMVTSNGKTQFKSFTDLKFYIAGGVTNLAVFQVIAFDEDGNILPDVVATIE